MPHLIGFSETALLRKINKNDELIKRTFLDCLGRKNRSRNT